MAYSMDYGLKLVYMFCGADNGQFDGVQHVSAMGVVGFAVKEARILSLSIPDQELNSEDAIARDDCFQAAPSRTAEF